MIPKHILKKLERQAYGYLNIYNRYISELSNPDPVLNSTGDGIQKGLALFREINRDPQIISDLMLRQLKVRSLPWDIQVRTSSNSDLEQAKLLKDDLESGYRSLVEEIQDAMVIGYAVVELMWNIDPATKRVNLGKGVGLEQENIRFRYEDNQDRNLVVEHMVEGLKSEPIPPEKYCLATFWETKGNVFGNSLMSLLFWVWFYKKHDLLMWANYLERYAQPFPTGKYPPGTSKEDQNKMLDSLEAIQYDFAAVFPEDWKVELLEAKRSGTTTYEEFTKKMDMYASKIILMSTMVSNETKFGTRAQAEVHASLTAEAIEDDSQWLEKVITDQVVTRLAKWNYHFTPEAKPHLVIHYRNEDVSKEAAERDETLSRILPLSIDELWEKYSRRIPEDTDIVTFNGELWEYGKLKKKLEDKNQPAEKEITNEEIEPGKPDKKISPSIEEEEEDIEMSKYAEFNYEPFFTTLDAERKSIDALFEATWPEFAGTVDIKKLRKLLDKADSFETASTSLDKYKNKTSKKTWQKVLAIARLMGEFAVMYQMRSHRGLVPRVALAEFSENVCDEYPDYKKIKPEEAIRWFRKRVPVSRKLWKQIEGDVKNAAFNAAGMADLELIQQYKESMLRALEEGKTYREWRKEVLEEYALMIKDAADGKAVIQSSGWIDYMRTAFNTNVFSALAVQQQTAMLRVTDQFPYWRYTAILDGKTRDAHVYMHGFIARYDDPIWTTWYPPNGFNCRCRVTIATQEMYDAGREEFLDMRQHLPVPDEGFDHNPIHQDFDKLLKEKEELIKKTGEKIINFKKINHNEEVKIAA